MNYLDPAVLTKVAGLDLKARLIVEGFVSGLHRSPYQGFSVEFAEHREYVPGDDLRHVDWKVYGKSDRYYLKQFEEETNFACWLLVDGSESMSYESDSAAMSKLEYAKYLAASLAYLVVDQGDSAGVGVFDGELQSYVEPKSSMGVLHDISSELEKTNPQPRTNIGAVVHEFAQRMSRRGFVMVFSDLFDNTEEFIDGLNHLRFRGHNVILFHVLDPFELEFPLNGMWKFVGLEGEGDLITQPARVRENYLRELESFISEIKGACTRAQVDYVLVNTRDPVEHVLSSYLLQREALARTR